MQRLKSWSSFECIVVASGRRINGERLCVVMYVRITSSLPFTHHRIEALGV